MITNKLGMNIAQQTKKITELAGKKSILETKINIPSKTQKLFYNNTPVEYMHRTLGKRKVPRFLYHFTTVDNYEKILKSGVIKKSEDGMFHILKGVFMVDLDNLLKGWQKSNFFGSQNLSFRLLGHTLKKEGDKLVCIRIPSDKLQHSNLKFRSQKELLNLDYRSSKKNNFHIIEGEGVINNRLYRNRNEAIEFIYEKEIPASIIQLAGKAGFKVKDFENTYYSKNIKSCDTFSLNILSKIFKNQPEEKAVNKVKSK